MTKTNMDRRAFILEKGVKDYGIKMGVSIWIIAFIVMPVLVAGDPPNWEYLASREFLIATLGMALLAPIAGWIVGWWSWTRSANNG